MSYGEGGIGRLIVVSAIVLLILGLAVAALEKGKLPLGRWRIPGDISFHRGPLHVWVPLGTCIVLSLVLTVLLNILHRR